jgi:hypothetical protein
MVKLKRGSCAISSYVAVVKNHDAREYSLVKHHAVTSTHQTYG